MRLSISEIARGLTEPWETGDLVTVSDSVVRVVRVEGVMDWHRHEEDQLFMCWEGTFTVEVEDGPTIHLEPGDVCVVPRQVRHKTSSERVAFALMSIGVHTPARV